MNIQVQKEATAAPLYLQIQERVRLAISEGAIAPGDRLWTELELANEFQTTRGTVRHALDQLVFEGLITRQKGRGSFVAEQRSVRVNIDSRQCMSFEEQVAMTGRTVTYRSPRLMHIPAPYHIAQQFGIVEGADVFELQRLRLVDNLPVCLETRYIPYNIGYQLSGEMLARLPAHSFIEEILGERVPTILVSITAEIADRHVAAALELAEPAAVSVRTSAHYSQSGSIVLCGRCIFGGQVSTDYVLGLPLSD